MNLHSNTFNIFNENGSVKNITEISNNSNNNYVKVKTYGKPYWVSDDCYDINIPNTVTTEEFMTLETFRSYKNHEINEPRIINVVMSKNKKVRCVKVKIAQKKYLKGYVENNQKFTAFLCRDFKVEHSQTITGTYAKLGDFLVYQEEDPDYTPETDTESETESEEELVLVSETEEPTTELQTSPTKKKETIPSELKNTLVVNYNSNTPFIKCYYCRMDIFCRDVHLSDENNFSCDKCLKNNSRTTHLLGKIKYKSQHGSGVFPCSVCNKNYITTFYFHTAHNKAEADGGLLVIQNLQPTCGECNNGMGTVTCDIWKELIQNNAKNLPNDQQEIIHDSVRRLSDFNWTHDDNLLRIVISDLINLEKIRSQRLQTDVESKKVTKECKKKIVISEDD
jgi:hypothetical protein